MRFFHCMPEILSLVRGCPLRRQQSAEADSQIARRPANGNRRQRKKLLPESSATLARGITSRV